MSTITRRGLLATGGFLGIAATFPIPAIRTASAQERASLTLYNGQHQQTTDSLIAAFTRETGIAVKARKGSGTQLANQIMEEGSASPADIIYTEESPPIAALAEKNLLAKLDDGTLNQIPAKYRAKDGTWVGASIRCRVAAYNKEMVEEDELPASVLDFASEKWKGRVAYVPTSGAFQEQIVAIKIMKGDDAALSWLAGLRDYGSIYNSNSAAMKAVEQGQIATALINNYYWFALAREVGADRMKSALFYFADQDPGALLSVSAAAMLKSSRNPEAARKFMAFIVSEKGQQAIVDVVAEYPTRPGVKSPFDLKPLDELDPPPVTPADIGDASEALALMREAGLA
jgi:iron(III) transport system substrate-binding protein